MIPSIILPFDPDLNSASSLLAKAIQGLIQAKDNSRSWENEIQLLLNQGLKPTREELCLLRASGYSISFDAQTLEKFKTFVFPNDPELTEAIQSANPQRGLLIDRHKMYRPGPASAKDCQGAAKGYNEIFALFEQQTTEKRRIAKDTYHFLTCMEENLPEEYPWKKKKTILDVACGNGVQIQELLNLYPCSVIGIDNQKGCIDHCQKLIPNQTFELHDCFGDAPSHLKQKADILFVSHLYCSREKATLLMERVQEYQASENTLIVFVNGTTDSDADRVANKFPFLRGKPSSSMSDDFKKALENHGYKCIEKSSQARVLFPKLTPMIRQQLLQIQRGDYENPYPHIDQDFKTFKALMEFIASYPLESMNEEEIVLYLNELEETFKANGGSYLTICNQMIFACPINADELFQTAFRQAEENSAFEKIRNQMGFGRFEEAKKELGKLLETLEDKDLEKSIAGFQLMSEIHLEEGKYPEAAGILWYAKRLDTGGKAHRTIDAQLDIIERSLLRKMTSQEGPVRGIEQSKKDQKELKQLREKIKEEYKAVQIVEDDFERAKALRSLYQHIITKRLKEFIDAVSQDVIQQLTEWGQNPPCEYALIGLGSLAREEMTPYSDFEFAILIDSQQEEDKEYFRLFTNLLHLRFINFGETILPSLDIRCLDWVFDAITPRGLSFDGSMSTACKTPLGKKGVYELIHPPEEMSRLQFIDVKESGLDRLWILQRYHLPSILATSTYVTGSLKGRDLISDYQQKVQTILENGEGKLRAFDLMNDDLNHFKPDLEEETSGKNYNVKKDLYRLPNTMFDGLANYFSLKSASSWERIEELEQKGIFTPTAAQDLKGLVILSQEFRLSTYMTHDAQREHLDIDTKNANLQEMYYRVLPFAQTMETFCSEMKNGSPENCLKRERFYENSSYHQGIIALRHMDYKEAYKQLTKQVFNTLEYYEALGSIKNILAKYQEAEGAYQTAIEIKPSFELYIKLGVVRQSLGRFKREIYGEKSAEESFFIAMELAEKSGDLLLLEKIYRYLTSFYKECGDFVSTRKYLTLCKEHSEKRTSTKKKDPEYKVILDLDLAKIKELEASILSDLDSEFKKSTQLNREARKILKGYYRSKNHPKVLNYLKPARNFNERELSLVKQQKKLEMRIAIFGEKHPDLAVAHDKVGITLEELGKHKEALEHVQKALDMRIEIFEGQHPDVAVSYSNVGFILAVQGKYEEALEHHQKALKMQIKIFGEQHPHSATSYINLGSALGELGKHKEALEHLQKALKLQIAIFGEQHPHVAISYSEVGITLGKLGKLQDALEHHHKALKLQIAISGEKHPSMAASYSNVGLTLSKLGQHQRASVHQQKALKMQIEIFEEGHPEVATSYDNLGFTLWELGKHQEALEHQQKALEIRMAIFGKKHPSLAISYNNLGGTLCNLGKFQEALEHQQKGLRMQIVIFGEKHPNAATSYHNVGVAFSNLGKHQEALEHLQKALDIQIAILGKQHPDVATSYVDIGYVDFKLKNYSSAILNLKLVLCILQSHPHYHLNSEIVNIHNHLASSYAQQNNKQKYGEHIQESQKISKELENQKAFQKNGALLADFLHNKDYKKAYDSFMKLPKSLKEAPQFFCQFMHVALLCTDLTKKTLEKHIQAAEATLDKGEGSVSNRLKLCVSLATYWLSQMNWDKANECVKQLSKILEFAPTLCFQYELLDLLAFGENPCVEGECIPAEILRNFFFMKIYQGRKNTQVLPTIAKQLLEKIEVLDLEGHKIEEIKNFCLSYYAI